MVGAAVPGNQVRGTAAGTILIQPLVKRRHHGRVICQPEVIVAAEGQQHAPVHVDLDTLRPIDDLPAAVQAAGLAFTECCRQIFH